MFEFSNCSTFFSNVSILFKISPFYVVLSHCSIHLHFLITHDVMDLSGNLKIFI